MAGQAAHLLHTSIVDLLNLPVAEFFRIHEVAKKINDDLKPPSC